MKHYQKSIKNDFRLKNDDRIGVFEKEGAFLFMICDGIGGYEGGDQAASIVVRDFGENFQNKLTNFDFVFVQNWIDQVVAETKKNIKKVAENNPKLKNMGTTLSGLLLFVNQKTGVIFNCGDSRTYVLSNHKLVQATRDNNVMNKMIDEGFPEEVARNFLKSNYLTSAIGLNISAEIQCEEIVPEIYQKIDKILITSDGIHDYIYHSEIQYIMNQDKEPQQIVDQLIETAKLAHSTDNISAIVIQFGENHDKTK